MSSSADAAADAGMDPGADPGADPAAAGVPEGAAGELGAPGVDVPGVGAARAGAV
jgi:hypothetical protein